MRLEQEQKQTLEFRLVLWYTLLCSLITFAVVALALTFKGVEPIKNYIKIYRPIPTSLLRHK